MSDYYMGIDIGTNSVGWAVTDEEYNILKFKGKRMWGIRLFESADTAEERRVKRANRRRLARRKKRIELLQELFAEEIYKVDNTFFIRLNESRLHIEDKTTEWKYPLFKDDNYNDVHFHSEYPTIYHLREDLIRNTSQHDIRMVYLACHHILKNRGHFLIDGDIGEAKNLKNICENFEALFNDISEYELRIDDISLLESTLSDKKKANSVKAKEIAAAFIFSNCEDKYDEKICKAICDNICKLLVGNKGDLKKIFNSDLEDIDVTSFKFSESKFEDEIMPQIESLYPDEAHALSGLKAIYDWSILVEILAGEEYLSTAKVRDYEKHGRNLKLLKGIIRKYCTKEQYREFFNDINGKSNYGNYIGSITKNGMKYSMKKTSEEDFYKNLSAILKSIQPEISDAELVEEMMLEAENHTLLPLLRTKDNGVIPNQIHVHELSEILNNAEKYLPFLNDSDEDGITVKEKIMSLASFRIPYYVGPLSKRHADEGSNTWVVRKNEGRIYPWNFREMVDLEKSNEAFIRRMTNKCTYLIGEDVLPKNSLLYSKFMVLNELNNLKIRGNGICVELKQNIYNDLFCKRAKVKGNILLNYLKRFDSELELEDLSGFDKDFKASLTSYLDFEKKVLGDRIDDVKYTNIVENIIKWRTIYGDDTKMLKAVIQKEYPQTFDAEQIKAIGRFSYSGWGNFSERFLTGIEGTDLETGECFTIMDALWNTNCNLMQLLSKRFTFREQIDLINAENEGKIERITYDITVKDLITSPANKRAIWQTLQITEEIKKIMKREPKRIFIEMARGNENEKNRTKSRKDKLIELYQACKDDTRDWLKEINERDERDFNSKKLYLYYLQRGRCMYTENEIDVELLMSGNLKWDIDHIYPRSKIKDDSIDNMVLVEKDENSRKDNELLSADIRKRMRGTWKSLYDQGFMSKKKYDRLTRTNDFTDEELAGFIERQIVETRQSTKAVADLLKRIYETSEVVYVKAGLVSDFRHDNKIVKSRLVNDYHHAKDAYLNIVVGDVYNAKFTSNPLKWIKNNRDTNYSIKKVFDYDIKRGNKIVWHGRRNNNESIARVKKNVERNDILYTEYTYCEKGQLFDETIYPKGNESMIPIKKELDTSKYGGYKSAKTSAFALIEFDGKKGVRQKHIVDIPIYIANMAVKDNNVIVTYLESKDEYNNVEVKRYPIKKNACISVNGYLMRIRGGKVRDILFKNAVQLILNKENYITIKKIESYINTGMTYEPTAKYDGFTSTDLDRIYDELSFKLSSTIYKNRPANQVIVLEKGRNIFVNLENISDKVKIIKEVLTMLRCDAATTANLQSIGGTSSAGRMSINKNTVGKSELILINQSVTGLFETREKL